MKNIDLTYIANTLNGMRCEKHDKPIEIDIREFAVVYNDVCCEEFKNAIDARYEMLVEHQVRDGFEKMYSSGTKM